MLTLRLLRHAELDYDYAAGCVPSRSTLYHRRLLGFVRIEGFAWPF